MSKIYTPTEPMEFLAPFGPTMGYFRLPAQTIDALNGCLNDKLEDYSGNLVGKVKEELKFDGEARALALSAVSNFVFKFHSFSKS